MHGIGISNEDSSLSHRSLKIDWRVCAKYMFVECKDSERRGSISSMSVPDFVKIRQHHLSIRCIELCIKEQIRCI